MYNLNHGDMYGSQYIWVIDQARGQCGWILASIQPSGQTAGWWMPCSVYFVYCCRLAAQKEQFLEKKETLMKEIHTKKEFLDSLQPRLENILKVKKISSEETKYTNKLTSKNFEEWHACINISFFACLLCSSNRDNPDSTADDDLWNFSYWPFLAHKKK